MAASFHLMLYKSRVSLPFDHIKMRGTNRADIYPGLEVEIILKKDQRTGRKTTGIVKDILTSAPHHSRGIKVRLEDGQIGRVANILGDPE